MKFSILQEEFEKGINTVYRFINPRPQLPILSHILMTLEKGRMRLCTTNLEGGINYWLGVKIEKEGSITIPARTLLEVVGSLPTGKIDIEENNGVLTIACAGSLITIPTTPANEFPSVLYTLPKQHSTFENELFTKITQQVVWAAGGDETKPVFTGLLFLPREEGIMLVATDGVRLSRKTIKTSTSLSTKILIPARIIAEIPKIFTNTKVISLALQEEENQVLFGSDDVVVAVKLLEGEFPDFEKIIPSSWSTTVLLEKEELQRALRLSSIFAKDFIVKFQFNARECTLTSEDAQTGTQTTALSGKVEGEEISISFNWRFIHEFLTAVEGEEVQFRFVSPTSPGVFVDPKDESFLHLIMPIRTNSE
ncbi:DNA polymerase III subunit beta [Candidatus Microgenomates bacterium]|nr:DNA polymerase III subunit beta [Candidatus Microgenomates bacterium]